MDFDLARQLAQENSTKILLFVMDGLGGLPHPETGRTELESDPRNEVCLRWLVGSAGG